MDRTGCAGFKLVVRIKLTVVEQEGCEESNVGQKREEGEG